MSRRALKGLMARARGICFKRPARLLISALSVPEHIRSVLRNARRVCGAIALRAIQFLGAADGTCLILPDPGVRQMRLEFLCSIDPKTVRTVLYNDQEFTEWELELLHTPVVQRLYNLKQLGFADRVFPDAVHSRLNHVLGVAEMAQRMAVRLQRWCKKNEAVTLEYVQDLRGAPPAEWERRSIRAGELGELLARRIPVVRMIGLLHDLTHAAFGHTLEDEVNVFEEKHDQPERQARFFNALAYQLVYLWAIELRLQDPEADRLDAMARLEVDAAFATTCAEAIRESISNQDREKLVGYLRQLEEAMTLLSYIEFMHESHQDAVPTPPQLLVSAIVSALSGKSEPANVVLHRDALMIDIVANTICADLLDYARRDSMNAALRVQFDDRFIKYACCVSVSKDLSPTRQPCIRLAVQFFTDKMRHDVLSEMSGILKARYLISERVLFHPTKCAAGAMLGTAIQLLGVTKLAPWMQALGDQELLRLMLELGEQMAAALATEETSVRTNGDRDTRLAALVADGVGALVGKYGDIGKVRADVEGARVLLLRLMSRRYAKPMFRLRAGVLHSGGDGVASIAEMYSKAQARFELEREIEAGCNLPPGTLVIHCPKAKMSMKVAQALVVGADPTRVEHLRNVDKIVPEALEPYTNEIKAVEDMYASIWQLHAFLESSHYSKRAVVEHKLEKKLGFPNDALLKKRAVKEDSDENPYEWLVGELGGQFAPDHLLDVIRRLDSDATVRMRHGKEGESVFERTRRIIREVEESKMAMPKATSRDRRGTAVAPGAVAAQRADGARRSEEITAKQGSMFEPNPDGKK